MSEDFVQYRLFPPVTRKDLTLLALKYSSELENLSSKHVWHYQSFNLYPAPDELLPQLVGCTCHRGNIEDEWFIVWLLFELSKKERDLVISITDDDGQFLLIESAHYLPKWLKPETAENRVYIQGGVLHVIPQPQTPGEVSLLPVTTPTLSEGVALIRNDSIKTVASESIQHCIHKRLSKCPPPLQTSHVFLPLPVAHLFSIDKQLVVSSAHALIERDKQDMKVAVKLDHFSPMQYPMVMSDVQMPRLLYAMLLRETVSPGPSTAGGQSFDLSLASHTLGIKLSYGLEILISRYGCGSSNGGSGDSRKWLEFMASLKLNGYFGDEIEGSARYQALFKSARDYYNKNISDNAESSVLDKASKEACSLLSDGAWSEETFKNKTLRPPDDESWLNVSEEQLEQLLEERAGFTHKNKESESCLGLEEASFGIKTFVDHVSSFDGAEFPWSADNTQGVSIDGDGFIETLENMLNKLQEPSDDEYEEDILSDDDIIEEDGGSEGEDIKDLMEEMDRELASTTLSDSFRRAPEEGEEDKEKSNRQGSAGEEDGKENLQPLDIDYNLLSNLIDSYNESLGQATPSSNMLRTLGISLPSVKQLQK
ncbi:PREDICTED: protein ecdysoneless homolog [Amphimedon queenslandica]|uniref:Uncharacterized protein n=1 Tax=Amphimedon queenslandica TaxID=400682 RepID=A0A1X7VES7_AMPQE|nr:PREDICTED: protein ecdysoneless homolog [Amphimedon queenslandica]|eukprot:XP_003384550.1 PREDICTED: protein ecdysoneless homolog [Amphimedon queenslandica]